VWALVPEEVVFDPARQSAIFGYVWLDFSSDAAAGSGQISLGIIMPHDANNLAPRTTGRRQKHGAEE
jgi:hypothetical protein